MRLRSKVPGGESDERRNANQPLPQLPETAHTVARRSRSRSRSRARSVGTQRRRSVTAAKVQLQAEPDDSASNARTAPDSSDSEASRPSADSEVHGLAADCAFPIAGEADGSVKSQARNLAASLDCNRTGVSSLTHRASHTRLFHLHELLQHAHEDVVWYTSQAIGSPWVLSRYRAPTVDWRAALHSAYRIHNETCNIFTHLMALLGALSVAIVIVVGGLRPVWHLGNTVTPLSDAGITADHPHHDIVPTWPHVFFLLGFAVCTCSSVLYHTFSIVNPRAFEFLLKLDYAAICVLGLSCGVASSFMVFHCHQQVAIAVSTLCIASAAAACYLIMLGKLQAVSAGMRVGLFAVLVVANTIPHTSIFFSGLWDQPDVWGSLQWMAACLALHSLGGVMYATHVPERFWPGRFDLFHSHTFMHVCVAAASWCYFVSLLRFHAFRLRHPDCTADVAGLELPSFWPTSA